MKKVVLKPRETYLDKGYDLSKVTKKNLKLERPVGGEKVLCIFSSGRIRENFQ